MKEAYELLCVLSLILLAPGLAVLSIATLITALKVLKMFGESEEGMKLAIRYSFSFVTLGLLLMICALLANICFWLVKIANLMVQ